MSYNNTQITKAIEREHGEFYHPRTGQKFDGCTANDHRMPPHRREHLNGCPKIAYHRQVNALRPDCRDASQNKPTGQLKTVHGGEQGNYAGFHQIQAHQDKRWIGVQTPSKLTFARKDRY